MSETARFIGQIVLYALFAVAIGYFASRPSWNHFPADQAMIKLAFAHGADRAGECRRLTPEEIAKLPPNMRRVADCPRGRLPVHVALAIDGEPIFEASVPPSGIAGDQPSRVYQKFAVEPGRHTLEAKLRDTNRLEGFDYEKSFEIELDPLQAVVLDFRADVGGFILR